MGNFDKSSFDRKKVLPLNIEGLAYEAVGWCNERCSRSQEDNCEIVILGGSRNLSSALYDKILKIDKNVSVRTEDSGYRTSQGEYIIDLDSVGNYLL